MRYFRSASHVYAAVCQQLDAAWGYPNVETKTLRALPLASDLPSDSQGRVYLAVTAEYCGYVLPSQILPQLLASGAVDELAVEQYELVVPPPPVPTP